MLTAFKLLRAADEDCCNKHYSKSLSGSKAAADICLLDLKCQSCKLIAKEGWMQRVCTVLHGGKGGVVSNQY